MAAISTTWRPKRPSVSRSQTTQTKRVLDPLTIPIEPDIQKISTILETVIFIKSPIVYETCLGKYTQITISGVSGINGGQYNRKCWPPRIEEIPHTPHITPFYPNLNKFLNLTKRDCRDKPVNHSVSRSISTNGKPVEAGVCRLSPTRYKISRDELQHMLDLGIIRRSSNN
ncbi:unnamed protein product [Hymenolepis diminuta]|uniref:Uncharacterized protein n=1 Tax=Hymenolepis diminuta TaxID=6216 RepID=A0A564Z645_HYMDI|nr:unnamed protein product [Hymenolepis diminuta]